MKEKNKQTNKQRSVYVYVCALLQRKMCVRFVLKANVSSRRPLPQRLGWPTMAAGEMGRLGL